MLAADSISILTKYDSKTYALSVTHQNSILYINDVNHINFNKEIIGFIRICYDFMNNSYCTVYITYKVLSIFMKTIV